MFSSKTPKHPIPININSLNSLNSLTFHLFPSTKKNKLKIIKCEPKKKNIFFVHSHVIIKWSKRATDICYFYWLVLSGRTTHVAFFSMKLRPHTYWNYTIHIRGNNNNNNNKMLFFAVCISERAPILCSMKSSVCDAIIWLLFMLKMRFFVVANCGSLWLFFVWENDSFGLNLRGFVRKN